MRLQLIPILIAIALYLPSTKGYCQWREPPATGSPENTLTDRTTLAGQNGLGPLLIAKLMNAHDNARKHRAVVEVQTDGVRIVDPAAARHQPKLDEAHIEYRLDNGQAQERTSKIWTVDNLSRGDHRIRVALVSSDNHQMGEEKILKLRVP